MNMKLAVAILALSTLAAAQHAQPWFTTTPINDLGQGLYLQQFQGGLYENGFNTVPVDHEADGLAAAAQVGQHGKFVFLGIGMSVSSGEFDTMKSFARADAAVNHTTMNILDGAMGSAVACAWTYATGAAPTSCYFNTKNVYDLVRDNTLTPAGFTEKQVEVVWVEVTNAHPATPWDCNRCAGYSLPAVNADAYALERYLGQIARAVKTRYPNVHQMFLASRAYGGYATVDLNPDWLGKPWAFETGFSVKWVIQAQVDQNRTGTVDPVAGSLSYASAPYLQWAAYNWASSVPRSDGLVWNPTDFNSNDYTHFMAPCNSRIPTVQGVNKVGMADLNFFKAAPETAWFRAQ